MVETKEVSVEITATAKVDVPVDEFEDNGVEYAVAMIEDYSEYIEGVDTAKAIDVE